MKRFWSVTTALAALGGAPSAFAQPAQPTTAATPAQSTVVERIVAVVNTEVILLSDLKERAVMMGQPVDDSGPPEQRRRAEQQLRQVLDRMVDDTLVVQQAGELKLTVENAEVDRAVDEVKKQNNLDDAQFAEALASQGYSPGAYRRDLRKQILRLKVINTAVRSHINITEEDLRAFYDQTVRQVGGKRTARVRHVLITVPSGADEKTVEQRRRLATRVLEEARAGRDFAELAKIYSDDEATKNDGGDLGEIASGEGLPENLSEVIFAMDPKEVRGPVRTERGFEVVQLVERKESDVKPFAEVKESIRNQLYGQQMEKQTQSWLSELRRKAHIDIRL